MPSNTLEEIFNLPQFSVISPDKEKYFLSVLKEVINHHRNNSVEFKNIFDSLNYDDNKIITITQFPFLPVSIFKELELKSIKQEDIIKTLTSSGTTGQKVSKIFLDSFTSKLQTKALANIVSSYIGKQRLPMLIIDSDNVLKDRVMFSARGAGILGLSNFGRDHLYILDKEMNLKADELLAFVEKYNSKPILLFGFTFMVWLHFIQELKKQNININLPHAVLIHSGGWKKLSSLNIDNNTFKSIIGEQFGINRVYNFYGMVEQVGSIYMECEEGYFHASNFSEIIIRDPFTFKPVQHEEKGIIQTISLLPFSYPGNSILTEDEGIIHGVDNCKCGRKGTYFNILGRIPKAELRGCSDTYAENIGE